MWEVLTSIVLLDVELAQESDGLVTAPASLSHVSRLDVASVTAESRHVVALRIIGAARRGGVHVDAEDTASAAKLVVDGTKINTPNSKLAKVGGTHDARLYRNVEGAVLEDGLAHAGRRVELLAVRVEAAAFGVDRVPRLRGDLVSTKLDGARREGKKGGDGHELGMTSSVPGGIGRIHSFGDHLAIGDKHTTNRSLVGGEGESGLWGYSVSKPYISQ